MRSLVTLDDSSPDRSSIDDAPNPGSATTTDPVAALRGVVATLQDFPVLAGVDLRIERGEAVLVSGPNGAGKTSLLRVLAGVLRVRAGDAHVLGADLVTDPRSHRHRVAFVGHETACYDDLSVRRNLRLHARSAGVDRAGVDEVIELLGLHPLADVAVGSLSTGQRRRCTLAIALARRAELLLLDEPHAGLDRRARDLVDHAVLAARSRGATVVLVSHELDRARSLADREVEMVNGFVKQK